MPDADSIASRDVRPQIRLPLRGLSTPAIIGLAVISGALLLIVLISRQHAATAQPDTAQTTRTTIASLPPLAIPAAPAPQATIIPMPLPAETPAPAPPAPPPQPRERIVYLPVPPPAAPPARLGPRASGDPVLVYDGTSANSAAARNGDGETAPAAGGVSATPSRASFLRNQATTVPQGMLIPAILETALDSTRPGLARALVTDDTRGFDGSRVLIPRGSRLVGEYQSQLAAGQKRALVTWTRLIRPDGATIVIGSPSSDTLGRAGIAGRVNSHFLARFGAAFLQSALQIGTNVATAKISNVPLLLGVPNGLTAGATTDSVTSGANVTPTIKVRQGTPITIFVARDLDFTSVEPRP